MIVHTGFGRFVDSSCSSKGKTAALIRDAATSISWWNVPQVDRRVQTMSNSNWQRAAIEQLAAGSRVAGTARGPVEYAEIGQGPAVLALHGRPGGYDQGLVMARSLGEDLARWIAVSRPGYLRTPLETGPTPAEQADAYAALLDTIGIGQAVVVGLSGGGPSALQFALCHSDRCRGLVLVSAVSRRKLPSERTPGQRFYDSVIGPSDRLAWFLYRLFGPIVGATGVPVVYTEVHRSFSAIRRVTS